MSRILLTGHTGFIGQALLPELLQAGHQVSTISRSNTRADGLCASLAHTEPLQHYLQQQRPEIALLLAWQDLPDYRLHTSLQNLNQQIQLIEMLVNVGCKRIIVSGSCWQYGMQSGQVSETTMPVEPGVFGCAKNAVLQFAQAVCIPRQVEVAEARIFYCYGQGQRPGSLLPTVLQNIKQQQPLSVRTPYAAVDFVHLSDVINAFLCLAQAPAVDGVYNVGSGKATTVAEVVNMAMDQLGHPPAYAAVTTQTSWFADISRLKQLGYQPKISIADGVRQLLTSLS